MKTSEKILLQCFFHDTKQMLFIFLSGFYNSLTEMLSRFEMLFCVA